MAKRWARSTVALRRYGYAWVWLVVLVAVGCRGSGPGPVVTSVSIADGPRSVSVGSTLVLSAQVEGIGRYDPAVNWSSGDAAIATVDGTGVVTGVASGVATISAISAFDAAKQGAVNITVTSLPAVAAVTIDAFEPSLVVGGTATLTVTVVTVAGAPAGVAWASDDASVVSVDDDGRIEAHAPGVATITAASLFDETKFDRVTITVAGPAWEVVNPYAGVDWATVQRHKTNLHSHTTRSDGVMTPAEAIDAYQLAGYTVLALTDHDRVTWPWSAYGRDPEALGMVAVQGAEPSQHDHLGSYFCDCPGGATITETMASVRDRDGLAVVFHPGRYAVTPTEYATWYTEWPELIGMEVYRQHDSYPGDRALWDAVLVALLPTERAVWAFANDDMHRQSHLGYSWNLLLLPELGSSAVREALEDGRFFFVHAPLGPSGPPPPDVRSITVDVDTETITIDATGYSRIEWLSSGVIVHEGSQLDTTMPAIEGYVRAMVYGADGGTVLGTQPIYLQRAAD